MRQSNPVLVFGNLLAVVSGLALPIAIWGQPSGNELRLREKAAAFREMTPDQQQEVMDAYAEYSDRGKVARRDQVDQIHQAVSKDPELKVRLEQFAGWWSAQDPSEMNSLLQDIQSGSVDVQRVNQRIQEEQSGADEIVIDVTRFMRNAAGAVEEMGILPQRREPWELPAIRFTVEQYLQLLSDAFPEDSLGEADRKELSEFSAPSEIALIRTLQVLDKLRPGSWIGQARRDGTSVQPGALAMQFNRSMHKMVTDPEWKKLLSGDRPGPAEKGLPMMIVLTQAASELTQKSPLPSIPAEQLMMTYDGLDTDVQRKLMAMSPQQAHAQLQRIAVLDQNSSMAAADRILLTRRLMYEANIDKVRDFVRRNISPRGRRGPDDRRGPEDRRNPEERGMDEKRRGDGERRMEDDRRRPGPPPDDR